MNEDTFNMEIRRFLKTVGITSQREIEAAVRTAVAEGRLVGDEKLDVKVTLSIGALALDQTIDGVIALS